MFLQVVLTGYETPKQTSRPRIFRDCHMGSKEKRRPGRPRIHPLKPKSEKRPRGRPRIYPVKPKLNRPRGRPPKCWKPLDSLMCSTSTREHVQSTGCFAPKTVLSEHISEEISTVPSQDPINSGRTSDDSCTISDTMKVVEETKIKSHQVHVPAMSIYILKEHSYGSIV